MNRLFNKAKLYRLLNFHENPITLVEVRGIRCLVPAFDGAYFSDLEKDFVFQLTAEENEVLKSQTVTSKSSRGGRRYAPYAFTEHGAIMAASVLNSPRAVEMSIFVVRAFLRLRETLATHKALAAKLAELEQRLETHDHKIVEIINAIHELAMPPEKPVRQIGFRPASGSKLNMLEAGTRVSRKPK